MYLTTQQALTERYPTRTFKLPSVCTRRQGSRRHFTSSVYRGIIKNKNGEYVLMLPVPGGNREHIVIKTKGSCLHIYITRKGSLNKFRRYVVRLPLDADTNFGSAELNREVLTICISQMMNRKKRLPGKLVVY